MNVFVMEIQKEVLMFDMVKVYKCLVWYMYKRRERDIIYFYQ